MPATAFETVDVFTTQRFGGNQLAVIADARGLSGEQMQLIAWEFHCSETAFVLPPQDSDNSARVRIFTPTNEIPFAGHPNIGTAFVLGRRENVFDKSTGNSMCFEQGAGLVSVDLLRHQESVVGARSRRRGASRSSLRLRLKPSQTAFASMQAKLSQTITSPQWSA
jgi:trans-2,3-dihydro-3-hydroxyanthranilate isomerase